VSEGLLGNLTQAAHIVAGMGISFGEALDIVAAAHDEFVASLDEPTPPTTIGNITYVDFGRR
jgi:hypothetical protein